MTDARLEGLSIIGSHRGSPGGEQFRTFDPRTRSRLDPVFHSASLAEVDEAMRLATEAFEIFRRTDGRERGRFLRTIADGIDAHVEALVLRVGTETALPPARIRSEAGRTSNQLRMFARLVEEGSWVGARVDRGDPSRTPAPKPDIRSMQVPLGPVIVFCASNFPLAFSVAGGDTASALAAGCPVVVNAHAAHAGVAEMVGIIIQDAVRSSEMPAGVFSLVIAAGLGIGQALVRHPAARAVGFTGSRNGGMALVEIASKRDVPIPVFAEMSSVNPVVVLPGAMAVRGTALAEGIFASVTLGAGQFCTNPGLVFIPGDATSDEFLGRVRQLASGGPAFTMLHEGIRTRYLAAVEDRSRRVQLVAGQDAGGHLIGAAIYATTAEAFSADPLLQEEIFGPSTLLISYRTTEELLTVIRGLEPQLTATVHGSEEEIVRGSELFRLLEAKAGRILINGYPTGVEVCDAMVHGGPFPATSDGRTTSVGTLAIERFVRPVCYQDVPTDLLPDALKPANPLGIWRLLDGGMSKDQG